jgi:hypothetical protein
VDHLPKVSEHIPNSISNIACYMAGTHLEIVSFDLWNLSPTCLIVSPVTAIYRKIASCFSKVMNFELLCPTSCNVKINALKTNSCTPSSVQICSGWP